MAIEDFGKKIGGARKDLRGSFTASDVADLTHLERIKLVRKDMVWPTPDFSRMVEAGDITPDGAAMIKMLRDSLPPAPLPKRDPTEEQYRAACHAFVPLINAMRDAVAGCRNVTDIIAAIRGNKELAERIGVITEAPATYSRGRPITTLVPGPGLKAFTEHNPSAAFGAVSDISRGMAYARDGLLDHETRKLFRSNPDWPLATSRVDTAIRKANATVGPYASGGFGVLLHGNEPRRENFDYYSRRTPFGDILGKTFPTAEAAQSALRDATDSFFKRQHTARKEKAAEVLGRVKPANSNQPEYRTGPDYREGRAATGEDFIKRFGLRGGEFGNWLNEVDRQQVLDRGFDAYQDLADVLGWAPDQISLGGTQAIAFGARGNGARGRSGVTPAAHYEPGRRVTNLTKPSGEGFLAHEWGHALDHHFGERAAALRLPVPGSENGTRYLSSAILVEKSLATVAPEHQEEARTLLALNQVMQSLTHQLVQPERTAYLERMTTMRDRGLASFREYLRTLVTSLRFNIERNKGATGPELQQLVSQCEQELEHWTDPAVIASYETELPKTIETLREIVGKRSQLKHVEAEMSERCSYLAISIQAVRKASSPDFAPAREMKKTAYYNAARRIDIETLSKKAYWSSPEELFARAFEACVEDRLVAQDRFNPFLVAGSHGPAFPVDAERTALVEALHAAIHACRTLVPRVEPSPEAVPFEAAVADNEHPAEPEPLFAPEPIAAAGKPPSPPQQMDLFGSAPPPVADDGTFSNVFDRIEHELSPAPKKPTPSISP